MDKVKTITTEQLDLVAQLVGGLGSVLVIILWKCSWRAQPSSSAGAVEEGGLLHRPLAREQAALPRLVRHPARPRPHHGDADPLHERHVGRRDGGGAPRHRRTASLHSSCREQADEKKAAQGKKVTSRRFVAKASASKAIGEAVLGIRTVASFNLEQHFYESYCASSADAARYGKRDAIVGPHRTADGDGTSRDVSTTKPHTPLP